MKLLSGKYELVDEPPESGKDVNEALIYRVGTGKRKGPVTKALKAHYLYKEM